MVNALPPEPPPVDTWRALGAVLGTIMGFMVAWPESRGDLVRRGIVSFLTGALAGIAVRWYFGWPQEPRFAMLAGAIAALFSWTAIAAVMRILSAADSLPFFKKGEK